MKAKMTYWLGTYKIADAISFHIPRIGDNIKIYDRSYLVEKVEWIFEQGTSEFAPLNIYLGIG